MDLCCSYEGTVWDDLAYGKGVYTTPFEMCRYLERVLVKKLSIQGTKIAKKMKKHNKVLG